MSDYVGDGSEFVPIARPAAQLKREECQHALCAGIGDELYCVGCHAPWKEVRPDIYNKMFPPARESGT
jgi:hypothetical protein